MAKRSWWMARRGEWREQSDRRRPFRARRLPPSTPGALRSSIQWLVWWPPAGLCAGGFRNGLWEASM
jgi:hypothetical protein